ncbi:hypothetical protein L1987_59517 [Smallanthus sonchifolius]|uniref:Uncharacterized protein n=1 Tax=Smallanthus sonchifolius TaxID=185202 RepID=A0ACB9D5H5_9ASTR|nr:hypothetical protein L1987_59517 [Smallanthus sonchifolius]
MNSKPWLHPAPTYFPLEANWDTDDNAPGPRCGHTLTAVAQTKSHGPRLILFGGATAIEGGTSAGISPAGHSTDDLYVLDLSNDKYKWHRGNDGKKVLSDTWALDTAQKPYAWLRINAEGDKPSARMYATASARSDGMFLLCGGRDTSGVPLADAYGLLMHKNGQWEWTLAPGVSPSSRYQHAAVFVGTRLHVTGGALRGGRVVDGEAAVAVLDTAAGVWLDRHGLVTSSPSDNEQNEDPSLDLRCRCRHAMSSVGSRLYVYGDLLLNDFLVAENSPFHSDANPGVTSERGSSVTTPRTNNLCPFDPISHDDGSENPLSSDLSVDKESTQTQAEANAAYSTWQAAQTHIASPNEMMISSVNSQTVVTNSEGGDEARYVKLHPRAVCILFLMIL